jgi:hypothetical protein
MMRPDVMRAVCHRMPGGGTFVSDGETARSRAVTSGRVCRREWEWRGRVRLVGRGAGCPHPPLRPISLSRLKIHCSVTFSVLFAETVTERWIMKTRGTAVTGALGPGTAEAPGLLGLSGLPEPRDCRSPGLPGLRGCCYDRGPGLPEPRDCRGPGCWSPGTAGTPGLPGQWDSGAAVTTGTLGTAGTLGPGTPGQWDSRDCWGGRGGGKGERDGGGAGSGVRPGLAGHGGYKVSRPCGSS